MSENTCPTCASPVTVEGKSTKYMVSENAQLRETVERYRTMYDNAFANWKSCAVILKRRDQENDELRAQLKAK